MGDNKKEEGGYVFTDDKFKFDKKSIQDLIKYMWKPEYGNSELTVYEDMEFNRKNYTTTGMNGTEFQIKTYPCGIEGSLGVSEDVENVCKDWKHREMHIAVYNSGKPGDKDSEIRVEIYGGKYINKWKENE